jgi:hypothetical protein
VEEVELWYWTLTDEARWRAQGWVSEPPDVQRIGELELLRAAHMQADAAEAKRRQQQQQAEAALGAVKRGRR